MVDIYKSIEKKVNQVEIEMKRIGYWSKLGVKFDVTLCKEAFCSDKLSFDQWIQQVFIPNIRNLIRDKKGLPSESHLGAMAVRQYDYMSPVPEAIHLVGLLCEIDDLINKSSKI